MDEYFSDTWTLNENAEKEAVEFMERGVIYPIENLFPEDDDK